MLRDEAPVWQDPITGMYVITRFDDVRDVLLEPKRFANGLRPQDGGRNRMAPERARRMLALYQDKGWVPAPTLAGRDDPNHKEMRAMFNEAFRPKRINAMDPFVEATAYKLIDAFRNNFV